MPTVDEVLIGLNNLIREIPLLMRKWDRSQNTDYALLDQQVEHWTRRVHFTLTNWGLGEDADRFSGASYESAVGEHWRNIESKAGAQLRVLKALRHEIAGNRDHWETQLAPKPEVVAPRPLPPPKPANLRQESARLPKRQESNLYFVAHEFSASGLDDLRAAIKEALRSSGLEPYFADKEIIEGQIFIDKILPKIRNCRFGIYDISNPGKPNVFIELGAAIAIGARYYIVVREGVSIPSDLQGLDRIEYRSFEHLKAQLREKIKD